MKKGLRYTRDILITMLGSAMFALAFNLFLKPNELNAGGISGLAMVLSHVLELDAVGTITAVINVPLFLLAGFRIGKRFFFGSLMGMVFFSVFLDLFAFLPYPETEPLIGALYGGVIAGFGIGIIFTKGNSTGGSDIIVRLLKQKWRDVPIGIINILFDLTVAILTGLVFRDATRTLYSGVAVFVSGRVVDAVVYRFDYSRVALIITKNHKEVAASISKKLDRGATFLHGEGVYTGNETKVILTAVKRQQLTELKELVVQIDPEAFIIVQEAHQVLGDGFSKYSKDSL